MRPFNPRSFSLLLALVVSAGANAGQPGLGGGGDVSGSGPDTKKPAAIDPNKGPAPTAPTDRAGDGEVALTPRFIKGSTTRYALQIVTDQKNTCPQEPDLGGTQKLDQGFDLALKVVESSEERSVIELSVERVRLGMSNDSAAATVDSGPPAKPGAPAPTPAKPKAQTPDDRELEELLQAQAARMIGEKMTITTDSAGKITKVSGGSLGLDPVALLGGGGDAGGGGGAAPSTPGAAEGGGGALQWLISGASGQPSHARVGQTWTNQDSLGQTPLGDFRMTTKYAVQSVRAGKAEIRFTGAIGGPEEARSPSQAVQIKRSNYSGAYAWDGRAGQLSRMSATMETEIEANLSGAKIQSVGNTKMSVERVGE